ncbi:MAG: hypothetical protein F6K55_42760 [Moorea sp. SIO4A3]|nr:hypothetical protein [Moorena sp. SIO4A3]
MKAYHLHDPRHSGDTTRLPLVTLRSGSDRLWRKLRFIAAIGLSIR